MRWWKKLTLLVATIWSIFVFVASNDPVEVSLRIKGWFAIPWMQGALLHLSNFAASTLVLAATFFLLGAFCSSRLLRRKSRSWRPVASDWAYDLGDTMIDLRDRIQNLHWENNVDDLFAAINVTSVNVRTKDIVFPDASLCSHDPKLLIPYLTNVGACLKANQITQAKSYAEKYAMPANGPPSALT